jgi:hypothetical protein
MENMFALQSRFANIISNRENGHRGYERVAIKQRRSQTKAEAKTGMKAEARRRLKRGQNG